MEDRQRAERRLRLQRAGGTVGGYAVQAKYPKEELRAHARLGIRVVVLKRLGDIGDLETRDPAEFARRYDAALHQHMAEVRLRGAQKPRAKKLAVLWRACPECNGELGLTIPIGSLVESCHKHWIAANLEGFNAILDDAERRLGV